MDTLKAYEQLIKSGQSESQAKAMVYLTMDAMVDTVTNANLTTAIQSLEQHLKIYFSYMLGGTVLVTILLPLFLRFIEVI